MNRATFVLACGTIFLLAGVDARAQAALRNSLGQDARTATPTVSGVAEERAGDSPPDLGPSQDSRIRDPEGNREDIPQNPLPTGDPARSILLRKQLLAMPEGPPVVQATHPRRGRTARPDVLELATSREEAVALRRQDAASGAVTPPSALGLRTTSDVLVRLQPGIHAVNGRVGRLRFTPGGQYVIAGRGFGSERGTVFLRGDALGQTLHLEVDAWQDNRIYASMPAGISGAADMGQVLLVVAPSGGTALESRDFGFLAARESVALHALPPGAEMRAGGMSPNSRFVAGMLEIERFAHGERMECFQPGRDVLSFARARLAPGFELDRFEYWHGPTVTRDRTSDGSAGNRIAFGEYGAYWEGDDLVLPWAVQREHRSPYGLLSGQDSCASSYRVRLFAIGPRGLAP